MTEQQTIVNSSYSIGTDQKDGRFYVTEKHVLNDGNTVVIEYLADEGMDYQAHLEANATYLLEQLTKKEAEADAKNLGESVTKKVNAYMHEVENEELLNYGFTQKEIDFLKQ